MPCTEEPEPAERRRVLLSALAAVALLAAGCASKAPEPAPAAPAPRSPTGAPPPVVAPAPEPPAPAPPPAMVEPPVPQPGTGEKVDLGPRVVLPAPAAARNWDEFKRLAARRMVAASPKASYMGKPQPLLFGIPVIEIELNADGSVRDMTVVRSPASSYARNTIDYAMEAVRRGAPYGDVSRLPRPWKWTEVFLFNDKRQFKPRTLD